MIRERVKKQFFGEISPKRGWVGWLIPKQGPNPSKPPQITPKIAFFDPNFTLLDIFRTILLELILSLSM